MYQRRTPVRPWFAVVAAAISFTAAPAEVWLAIASSTKLRVSRMLDLWRGLEGIHSHLHEDPYASVQKEAGVDCTTDVTLFLLDCTGARYGSKAVSSRRFGQVIGQFSGAAGELRPIPAATRIDAVVKAVCSPYRRVRQGESTPGAVLVCELLADRSLVGNLTGTNVLGTGRQIGHQDWVSVLPFQCALASSSEGGDGFHAGHRLFWLAA
ncbi:hypothetical protein [Paraburkholderia caledonica]|jgi:hypothetical protein|uniref:hypothetical protein n=1 Tax=Paraburkholderia caledonica TaxID=134536 RepID=UPI000480471B|nr:hypothetical protein [Paraburkholderia caledonica]